MPGVRFRCGVRLHEVRKKIIYMRWLLVLLLQNVTTTCGLNREIGRSGGRDGAVFSPGLKALSLPTKKSCPFLLKKHWGDKKIGMEALKRGERDSVFYYDS